MNCNLEWNNTHLGAVGPSYRSSVVANYRIGMDEHSEWNNHKKDYDKGMDLLFVQEIEGERMEAYVPKQTICLTKGHLKTTQ